MATSKQTFSQFLTQMAEKSEKANQATIDKIKEKLEKEAQERIEKKVLVYYASIQEEVQFIRSYRRRIDDAKARITEMEKKVTAILNGEDD